MSANGDDLLRKVKRFLTTDDTADLFPYPLPKLRKRLRGYRRGSLTVLSGYPSDGKTQLMLQFVEEALRDGKRVTIFSLEMDCLEVAQAMMTQGGVHPDTMQKRQEASPEDRAAMASRAQWMAEVSDQLRVVDHLYRLPDMEAYLDECPPTDLVVFDHLHEMEYEGEDERKGLERIAKGIRRMAKERKVAAIMLCQLSRPKDGGYPVPDNRQLRGTALIEGAANQILYVWRERDHKGQRTNDGLVVIGKMRNGQTDWGVDVKFHVPALKFYEQADPAYKHAKQALKAAKDEPLTLESEDAA